MYLEMKHHDRVPSANTCDRLTVRVGGFEIELVALDDEQGLYIRMDGLLNQLVVLPHSGNSIRLVSR